MVAQNHPEQLAWANSRSQFNVIAAGRRSFKTERAKRKLVIGDKHHCGALTKADATFFAAAPTFKQAKKIYWKDLKTFTMPYWGQKPSESELIIYLNNGSEIHVLGLDIPERVEGILWSGGGILDEFADMHAHVWSNHVQPVTADMGAWVDFIGVPDGRNHFYDIAEKAKNSGNPNWNFFTWKSSDVLHPRVIAEAKATLDERSYLTEYEASFLGGGRLVYYSFGKYNISDIPFDAAAETWLTWDFNATEKPMSVIFVQRKQDGTLHVPMEFVTPYTQTETMANRVKEWLTEKGFNGQLHIRGDSAGHATRSTATMSDYNILETVFKNYPGFDIVTRPTRKIRNRTSALNSLLRTADNTVRLTISPVCKELITDFERVEWKANEMELDGADPKRTHPTDALSYFAHTEYPTDVKETTTTTS